MFNRISRFLFGDGGTTNRSPAMEYSSPFLQWFNIGALLSVLLPFLLMLLSGNRRREGGGDEERRGWWNWWGNGGEQDDDNQNGERDSWWARIWGRGEGENDREGRGGNLPTLLVYLYSLMVFAGLIWYGNRVFRRGAFTLPLLTALMVFFNMGMLLALLLAAPDGDERQEEREGGLGLRGLAALTLGLMSLFSLLFFLLVRCRDHEYGVNHESQLDPNYEKNQQQDGSFFTSMDNNNRATDRNNDYRNNDYRNDNRRTYDRDRERDATRTSRTGNSNGRGGRTGFFT